MSGSTIWRVLSIGLEGLVEFSKNERKIVSLDIWTPLESYSFPLAEDHVKSVIEATKAQPKWRSTQTFPIWEETFIQIRNLGLGFYVVTWTLQGVTLKTLVRPKALNKLAQRLEKHL